MVWAGPKAADVEPMATARQAALNDAENEYCRLLYVAMTRASERLIVCGAEGERPRRPGCWYDLVRDALEPACTQEPADDGAADVLRFRKTADGKPSVPKTSEDGYRRRQAPRVAGTARRRPQSRAKPITPSSFADEPKMCGEFQPGATRQQALRRGSAVHRLMQSLPDVPAARRIKAARRFLAHQDGSHRR